VPGAVLGGHMPNISRAKSTNKLRLIKRLRRDFKLNKYAYLLLVPACLYYIIFHYVPLFGAQIAFRDFNFKLGIVGSPWVGFEHFKSFFSSYYFTRLITNTFLLSFYNILFGFPAPIILALMINEVKNRKFKRVTQSLTYLPHFISTVVVCGFILTFTARGGLINDIIAAFGGKTIAFMLEPKWFRTVYVVTEIWQAVGWGSIIYLASLSNINSEIYEACYIDGGGRFRQMISVTLPGIAPTIIILLILRMGRILNVGLEKVLLLYNPVTYETADIIQTFVYRKGLIELNYSYSAAVGLFNSVINFAMIVFVNFLCKKYSETSLW